MTVEEERELIDHNARELVRMNPSAAARVSGLMRELRSAEVATYLRLRAPELRRVGYEVVEGDRGSIEGYARTLGFRSWTDGVLEI